MRKRDNTNNNDDDKAHIITPNTAVVLENDEPRQEIEEQHKCNFKLDR